jgi:hypothetical protein
VSETIRADACLGPVVSLLRDDHPDSRHLGLWALGRIVSFTPTWVLEPEDSAASESYLIGQHPELYTEAQVPSPFSLSLPVRIHHV